MKFTISFIGSAFAFFAASIVSAAPLDVWDPTILSPVTGTVWVIGTEVNVTWSTANEPAQVSNGGQIVLAQNRLEILTLSPIFDLAAADGFFTVTVPVVVPNDNYQIVQRPPVFGDSGILDPPSRLQLPKSSNKHGNEEDLQYLVKWIRTILKWLCFVTEVCDNYDPNY
ncbi:hypothetical protein BDP27DRAFT_717529 [Rhodocollybia butyracea]|uniref:Uncharacterized protein n=1 Tax=Rhodocollybia butyracea TaxID=206335 RepID=A0A9P5PUA4_9AGAR|nr:hypothetical protein BDP27DRAFT_717529 [Rhodocollybia butyracea]